MRRRPALRSRTPHPPSAGRQSRRLPASLRRRATLELLEARRLLAADAYEPNNSFAAAANLGTGPKFLEALSIDVAGDLDFFKWQATGSGTATFEALFQHGLGDLDLEVYDAAFQLLGRSNTQTNNESVTLPVTAGASYYVKTYEFTTIFTQPDYDLRISEILPDSFEAGAGNDTSSQAVPLTVGSYNDLTIHRSGNQDWYQFTAPSAGALRIEALFAQAQGNVDLKLFNSQLSEIGASGSATDNELIVQSLAAGQSVFLQVVGAGGDVQPDYDLQLSFSQPPAISTIPNISVLSGQAGSSAFTISDPDTDLDDVQLSGFADNSTVVPTGNISFGGSGANRTVTVIPAVTSGFTTIRVRATDPQGNVAERTFSFSVGGFSFNFAPNISNIPGQSTTEDVAIPAINFTVTDLAGDLNALTITATSSDQSLVPNANLVLGGSGANRTLSLTPAANAHGGPALVTVTVVDPEGLSATRSFLVTVTPAVADAPNLSAAPASGNEDTAIPLAIAASLVDVDGSEVLELTIGGVPTGAQLSAGINQGAGNWSLAPSQLAGLTITPPPNSTAAMALTVTATARERSNLQSASTAVPLNVTVNGVQDDPTITPILSQTTPVDTPTGPLAFTVGDAESSAGSLVVAATSSNPTLVPNSPLNLTFSGAGADRALTVTPAAGETGVATITVTVTDGAGRQTAEQFELHVGNANTDPTISAIEDVTTPEDTSTGALAFVLGDAETDPGALQVIALSDNEGLVPRQNIVVAGAGANRTVTVTPTANAAGTAVVTLWVDDGAGGHATESFTVTVTSVNDAPLISPIADQAIAEDGSVGPISFVVGDLETGAGSVSLTASSSNTDLVSVANVQLGGTGAHRYVLVTPTANRSGTTTITLTASDGIATSQRSFNVVVAAVNDAPTISAIANQTTTEDVPLGPLAFTVDDVDDGAAGLIVTVRSSNEAMYPSSGIVLGGSGSARTVSFTPAAEQFGGPLPIEVSVSDGQAVTTTVFTINTLEGNNPPTISNISDITINEGASTGALAFTIADDKTPVGSLTITATSSNQSLIPNGNLSIGGSGANRTITVTPLPDAAGGPVLVTVTVSDGSKSAQETFNVTITGVNDEPTFDPLANRTVSEDATAQQVTLTGVGPGGGADEAGQIVTFTAVSSDPSLVPHPTITGSGATRTLSFQPAANVVGTVTITVTAQDNGGTAGGGDDTLVRTFTIEVTAVNDAPTFDSIANQTVSEDAAVQELALTGVSPGGGADEASQTVTFTATSSDPALVPNPTVTGSGATRTLSYQPAANAAGTVTITVTAQDSGGTAGGGADTLVRTFTIEVTPVNDAPTLDAIADQTVSEDAAAQELTLTGVGPGGGADEASQTVTFTATSSDPSLVPHPTITGSGSSRTLSYQPAANASGTVTITVTAQDDGGTAGGGADTLVRTFTIEVAPVNDAPTFDPLADQTVSEDAAPQELTLTGVGPSGNADEAGQIVTFTAVSSDPSLVPHPTITGSGDARTLSFQPVANAVGAVTITVTAQDDGGTVGGGDDTLVRTFTITVDGVNDAPTFDPLADQTVSEGAAAQELTLTGVGPGGGADEASQTVTFTATSSDPSLVPHPTITGSGATRTLAYQPIADLQGTVTITVTATDDGGTAGGGQDVLVRTFTIDVLSVNDAPTFDPLANQTVNEEATLQELTITGVGPGGGADEAGQTVTFTATSSDPSLVPHPTITGSGATRTLSYQPATNAAGTVTITVTAQDDGGTAGGGDDTLVRTFTIELAPVNDAPTFDSIADQTVSEDATAQEITLTGVGPGGGADEASQTLTFTATSSDPSLVPHPTITGSGATRTLSFQPAANVVGTVTITVTAQDDGGTASGGADTLVRTFTIEVAPVNDAPTFDPLADQTVSEDAAAQELTLTGAGPGGGADEASQTVTFTATSSNPSLVPHPTITGSGATRTLSYQPAANAAGTVTITLTAQDDGGTAGGGDDTLVRTFTIEVTPVNDAPTFDSIADQTVSEDAATQEITLTGVGPGGGADEASQTVTFTATSSDPALVPNPTVTGSGATRTLSFQPAANAVGTVTITVTTQDSGGTAGGGADTLVRTFTIEVTSVNDEPTFDPIANQTVNEDAPQQSVTLTGVGPGGGADEAGQTVTITATSSNPAIVPNPTITGSGATRTLSFQPAANAAGTVTITVTAVDNGGTAGGGDDTFVRTFTIEVLSINDEPTFDPIANRTVNEDAPVQNVTITGVGPGGGANEAIQMISFTAVSSNPAIVPNPTITGSGTTRTLSFQPVANAVGTVTITVTARDSGFTANGGDDTLVRTFTITVNGVNDAPVFNPIANLAVGENAPAQNVTITGVGPGGGTDEAGQTVTFTATSSNPAIVPNPTVSGSGASRTLSFQPAANAVGSVTITVTAKDSGGTASGGSDTLVRTFTIDVQDTVGDLPGDMNLNGRVDFDDLLAFQLGLASPQDYENLYGVPPQFNGDLNGDAQFDNDDVPLMVALLMGESAPAAPAAVAPPSEAATLTAVTTDSSPTALAGEAAPPAAADASAQRPALRGTPPRRTPLLPAVGGALPTTASEPTIAATAAPHANVPALTAEAVVQQRLQTPDRGVVQQQAAAQRPLPSARALHGLDLPQADGLRRSATPIAPALPLPQASAGQPSATQVAQDPSAKMQRTAAQVQRPATRPLDRFAVISAQRDLTDAEIDRVWSGL